MKLVVEGSDLRVEGLGFRVRVVDIQDLGLGFKVCGLGWGGVGI